MRKESVERVDSLSRHPSQHGQAESREATPHGAVTPRPGNLRQRCWPLPHCRRLQSLQLSRLLRHTPQALRTVVEGRRPQALMTVPRRNSASSYGRLLEFHNSSTPKSTCFSETARGVKEEVREEKREEGGGRRERAERERGGPQCEEKGWVVCPPHPSLHRIREGSTSSIALPLKIPHRVQKFACKLDVCQFFFCMRHVRTVANWTFACDPVVFNRTSILRITIRKMSPGNHAGSNHRHRTGVTLKRPGGEPPGKVEKPGAMRSCLARKKTGERTWEVSQRPNQPVKELAPLANCTTRTGREAGVDEGIVSRSAKWPNRYQIEGGC